MSKRRGSIRNRDGKLFARLTWTRANGNRGEREQRVETKSEAWRLIGDWLLELENQGDKALDAHKLTFNDLASHVRDRHFVEPIERAGRRISGVRTWKDRRQLLEVCREFFGRRLVRSITWGDVDQFRRDRLNTPTWRGNERAIATVNRELAVLRRAFNVAKQEGWLKRNPFEMGRSLIEVAHEVKRERILSVEEEGRLLPECIGCRAHLRPILICALDTGMRQGEIFTLTVADVNLETRLITLRSMNTKSQRARQVPISARLLSELRRIVPCREPYERVFGIEDNIKRSFDTTRKKAGIAGLRFHDLRHTAATRWIQAGIPIAIVSRLLGHADIQTTMRYVNPTPQMLTDVLAVFDAAMNNFPSPAE